MGQSKSGLMNSNTLDYLVEEETVDDSNNLANGVSRESKIQKLIEYGYECVQTDYHSLSKTHIVFNMLLGRFGIKGYGDSSENAFMSFESNLDHTLKTASDEEIEFWIEKCASKSCEQKRQQEIESIKQKSCSGKIGMTSPYLLYQYLSDKAHLESKSINSYCSSIIERRIRELWEKEKVSTTDEFKQFVLQTPKEIFDEISWDDNNKKKWILRISKDDHARLLLISHENKISVPQLCRLLLIQEVYPYIKQSKTNHSSSYTYDEKLELRFA